MSAETIFFIAILLFFFVVQGMARRKEAGRRQPPGSPPQRPGLSLPSRPTGPEGSEWQDALQEIHDKLAQAKSTQPMSTAPIPPSRLEATSTRLEKTSTRRNELQRIPPARVADRMDAALRATTPTSPSPENGKDGEEESAAAREIRELLRKPGGARKAVVLSEVLGPRHSRHPR
ncbi:MAG TPA: hypothetical protein VFG50_07860 [Rhodothermales bacterium]|nr:hypothetical protein [Rhodothermales bacterium]